MCHGGYVALRVTRYVKDTAAPFHEMPVEVNVLSFTLPCSQYRHLSEKAERNYCYLLYMFWFFFALVTIDD